MTHSRPGLIWIAWGDLRLKAITKGVPKETAEAIFQRMKGYAAMGFVKRTPGFRHNRLQDRLPLGALPRRVLRRHIKQRTHGLLPGVHYLR
jgi:hypothetical protein